MIPPNKHAPPSLIRGIYNLLAEYTRGGRGVTMGGVFAVQLSVPLLLRGHDTLNLLPLPPNIAECCPPLRRCRPSPIPVGTPNTKFLKTRAQSEQHSSRGILPAAQIKSLPHLLLHGEPRHDTAQPCPRETRRSVPRDESTRLTTKKLETSRPACWENHIRPSRTGSQAATHSQSPLKSP